MGKIITKWEFGKDFFKVNPSFEFIGEFRDIKNKNKNNYSDIMWNIALLIDDGNGNPYSNIPFEERKEIISSDSKERELKFDFSEHKEAIEKYQSLCETDAERSYRILKNIYHSRTKFIESFPIRNDNIDDLDKAMSNTPKLLKDLQTLKDIVDSEKEEGNIRGGGEESLSDQNII